MDPVSSRPPRKYRNVFGIDIPIIECKREFPLPHKFPGMVNSFKDNCLPKNYKTVNIANPEVCRSLNESKSKKIVTTNDIKKLRIKTKDGKDLGEVKVQFLARKNILNTSKVVYSQQTPTYKRNNPINLSIASQSNDDRLLKSLGPQYHIAGIQKDTIGPQYLNVRSEVIVKSVSPPELLTDLNKKSDETQNENINIHQKHTLNEVNKNQSNKLLSSNENKLKLPHNTQETVELQNNNLILPYKKNNDNVLTENKCSKEKDVINGNTSIVTEAGISKETTISNIQNSKSQLAKSKFPIVRCEKLSIPKTKINANEITTYTNKNKRRFNLDTSSTKKVIKLNTNAFSSNTNEIKKHDASIVKEAKNSTQVELNSKINGCNESDVVIIYEKLAIADQYFSTAQDKKNISIFANNKNISSPDSCKNKVICNQEDIQNKDSNFERSNDVTKEKEIEHNTGKENFSDCLSVIKEALTSVKDEQLRAKALHALAECGIGIAKQVPITPPDKLKTVHDSQIQTDVFGLLDVESFILMKTDTFALERIEQRERSSINSLPLMKEVQIQTEMQPEPKWNNYINDIDLLPMKNSVPLQDTINLDNFLNKHLNNNANINRVKEVLSTPHSLCKKMSIQLERDYEEMQHCDDNGLLNIHRAVINDQLHTVQRLLVVLKALKTNIDVLTDNRMTSLELAIKFGASKNMVKLLLEAGAKPVSSELLHESAVILASKLSSPFLPDLLNYVTEPKLLNHMDLSGMAPLHYCALNGYLDGVNALIKRGADVNLQDNHSGRTPFFHALENEHTLVAKKLLEYHAVADLPNFSGQSVMSLVDEAKSLSLKVALQQTVI